VTPAVLEDYQQKRLESVELKRAADGDRYGTHRRVHLPLPQTVNYELSVLRSAFIWGQQRGLTDQVPTRQVKKLKVAPRRQVRMLSEPECRLLLKTARQLGKESARLSVYAEVFAFF
jgi:site-specific recombinase XerD